MLVLFNAAVNAIGRCRVKIAVCITVDLKVRGLIRHTQPTADYLQNGLLHTIVKAALYRISISQEFWRKSSSRHMTGLNLKISWCLT